MKSNTKSLNDNTKVLDDIATVNKSLNRPVKKDQDLTHFDGHMKQNDMESGVLLSLSNAIATIRNKNDLFKVITNDLNSIFPFSDFVICLINEDKETHSPFLYNENEIFQKGLGIAPKSAAKYPIDDGLCNIMVRENKPIVFDVDDLIKQPYCPPWLSFWQNRGIKEMISFSITSRNECIGFFYLYAVEKNAIANIHYNLLRSIGLQISVAVANIRANEIIEEQLKRIQRYQQQLEEEKLYLKEQIEINYNFSEIIGNSDSMRQVFHFVDQVADTDTTVLILGETGTGKELIARAIHNHSSRKDKLMVKLNCATLSANLIESELFGHEKGSFTGATERRIGKFELANNGTLFLDEIGELPLELQVKLLRALQEREIERLGGKGVIKVDVRIITATNRNLYQQVQEGAFRSDLFYRLNVFPVTLPPLRNRKEDITALSQFFIDRYAKKLNRGVKMLSQRASKSLLNYHWPGNVRELEHLIERSVLLATGPTINSVHLPQLEKTVPDLKIPGQYIKSIFENERDHILDVLKHCQGKISGRGGAAEILGIPATTLNSKIKKFRISREHLIK